MKASTAVTHASIFENSHQHDAIEKTSGLVRFIEVLNDKLRPENIPAFRKPNQVTIPQAPASDRSQDVEVKAARDRRTSSGGSVSESAENDVLLVRVGDPHSTESTSWETISSPTDDAVSEAVSSESISPPLNRFIRIDENGRRHLLPPPGFGPAPKAQPEILPFPRKHDYKKPDIKYGGIALAMARDKEPETNTERGRARTCDLRSHKFASCDQALTQKTTENVNAPSSSAQRPAKQAQFWERMFEIEEDIVYNTRIPISTF
ncbi:hypothetical protein HD806DRAFT_544012 [Xylariaceae sp. AK1471]|nr:hypothetical protein HD806DRAFT_544012 [Xylariaceae sp. AK1471]